MSAFPWEFLIKATLWLAAAWVLQAALAKAHPRWRVLLWRLAMAAVLVLPFFLMGSPRLPVAVPMPSPKIVPKTAEVMVRPVETPPAQAAPAFQPLPGESANRVRPPAAAPSLPPARPWNFRLIFAGAYGGMALVLTASLALAWLRMRRLIKRSSSVQGGIEQIFHAVAADFSVTRAVRLRASPEIASPLLAGWLRPHLLLPAGLAESFDREQLRIIFAHEIAHLASRDMEWSLLIRLTQILLWFHPLAWRAGAAHGRACEEVADGISVRYINNAASYGATLAALAFRAHAWHLDAVSLPMARTATLPARLKNLARNAGGKRLGKKAIVSAAAVASSLLALGAAITVSLHHRAGRDLYGKMVDPDGKPISHAAILVSYGAPKSGESILCPSSYPDCYKQTTTDRNGAFLIKDVDPTVKFTLLTGAPGFNGRWQRDIEATQSPLTLTLKPLGTEAPAGRLIVRGRVLGRDGKPVPFALLRPQSSANEEALAVADAGGRFMLNLKAEPEWNLLVQARGYASQLVSCKPKSGSELAISLEPGVTVRGRLVQSGRGVKDATILLADKNYEDSPVQNGLEVETDAQGRFEFPDLTASRLYAVTAKRDTLPAGTAMRATLVRPLADSPSVDLGDLPAEPALTVPGQIHMPAGQPIPDGSRLLVMYEGQDYQLIDLRGDGTFETTAFPGEKVEIAARVRGYTFVPNEKGDPPRYFPIQDTRSRIDATLISNTEEAAQALRGVVLDPDGKPAADVRVGILLEGENASIIDFIPFKSAYQRPNVKTDKEGRFQLPATKSDGVILAVGPQGFTEQNLKNDSRVLKLERWSKIEGRYAPGGVAPGKRSISARLRREEKGKPILDFQPRTICDEEGHFVLHGVPGGLVQLTAEFGIDPVGYGNALWANLETSWGQTTKFDFTSPDCTVKGRVEIPEASAPLLDFKKNGSRIYRDVPSAFRPPADVTPGEKWEEAHQQFLATPEGRKEVLERLQFGVPFGPDGVFALRSIPPGKYSFSVEVRWRTKGALVNGGATGMVSFEILPGQQTVDLGSIPVHVGTPPLQPGDPVPSFDLIATDGTRVNSDALRGKILAIQLTQGDDARSLKNDHFFDDIRRAVADSDRVEYISLGTAPTEEAFQKVRGSLKTFWKNCHAPDSLAESFHTTGWPVEIIVDANGKLAYLGQNYGEAANAAAEELGKLSAKASSR